MSTTSRNQRPKMVKSLALCPTTHLHFTLESGTVPPVPVVPAQLPAQQRRTLPKAMLHHPVPPAVECWRNSLPSNAAPGKHFVGGEGLRVKLSFVSYLADKCTMRMPGYMVYMLHQLSNAASDCRICKVQSPDFDTHFA